jgi:hypothetical protein
MTKEFVPYDRALKLKELGFDEPCFVLYKASNNNQLAYAPHGITTNSQLSQGDSNNIAAPLFQQAFRWFREKYHIIGEPKYKGGLTTKTSWYDYIIYSNIDWKEDNKQYKTYEEAELACLDKLIDLNLLQ